MSDGVAFIQNNGLVLLKSGFSRDVYVMGIHHRSDLCAPGTDVVVLVWTVVMLLLSALRRRRKRSYIKKNNCIHKSGMLKASICCIFYINVCSFFYQRWSVAKRRSIKYLK